MQSPGNSGIQRERKLCSSAGYKTIYCYQTLKFDLTAKCDWMRKTVRCDNGTHSSIYQRVKDQNRINIIEQRSENWYPLEGTEYYILEQRNARQKRTGNYKIIKKSRAVYRFLQGVVAYYSEADWMYYERLKR